MTRGLNFFYFLISTSANFRVVWFVPTRCLFGSLLSERDELKCRVGTNQVTRILAKTSRRKKKFKKFLHRCIIDISFLKFLRDKISSLCTYIGFGRPQWIIRPKCRDLIFEIVILIFSNSPNPYPSNLLVRRNSTSGTL